MSKSFRTPPPRIIAQTRFKRDASGKIEYPRIVVQKPRPNDIYPIDKKLMGSILEKMPLEYLYGLKKIALQSRKSNRIGGPYGCYRYPDRMIVLYSVPSDVWVLDAFSAQWRKAFRSWGLTIEKQGENFLGWWEGSKLRHFFCAVLCHELGHHYTYQYDYKKKLIPDKTTNENLADLHGSRILLAIAKDLKGLIGNMQD